MISNSVDPSLEAGVPTECSASFISTSLSSLHQHLAQANHAQWIPILCSAMSPHRRGFVLLLNYDSMITTFGWNFPLFPPFTPLMYHWWLIFGIHLRHSALFLIDSRLLYARVKWCLRNYNFWNPTNVIDLTLCLDTNPSIRCNLQTVYLDLVSQLTDYVLTIIIKQVVHITLHRHISQLTCQHVSGHIAPSLRLSAMQLDEIQYNHDRHITQQQTSLPRAGVREGSVNNNRATHMSPRSEGLESLTSSSAWRTNIALRQYPSPYVNQYLPNQKLRRDAGHLPGPTSIRPGGIPSYYVTMYPE